MSRRSTDTHRLRVVRDGEPAPGLVSQRPPENARVERALAAMAVRITEARTVAESDRLQLAEVHSLVHPRASFVCRIDPVRRQLQISCVRGRNDPRIAAAEPDAGPIGKAFSNRHIVRREGFVVAPLLGPEGALGCLVLLSPRLQASDDLLKALAAQIVAAAEVARLRDEAARRTKDLETAVAGLKGLEKNREELLANVSHDLKNPLTTIKTYLTLLERGKLGPLAPRASRAIDTCQRNADRLLRMINDLLLVSRLEAGEMQLDERPFGLKAVVEDALRALAPTAEQAQVSLNLARSPEVFVRGNRTRILEAVFNVVENSIHSSATGGEVKLSLTNDPAGLARVSVQDQVEGLEPEDLERAFDSFYRAGPGQRMRRLGAELGLPIAAKIIRLHGGQVAATATPGKGSTLHLFLPAFAAAVAPAQLAEPARNGAILLVEDDRDCRDVLHQVLEEEGYRVVPAAGCKEALAALARARPALVLLDLRLSDGDGRGVLNHIRQTPHLADVPVYVISGASDAAELTAQPGPRVDGLLEKPLQLEKLLDVVSSVVRPAQATAADGA